MPRHAHGSAAGGAEPQASSGGPAQPSIGSSIQALDAKLKLIAQRIKIIENNEQVMGRTLVSHNKKMKDLEKLASSGTGGGGVSKDDIARLKAEIKAELKSEMPGSDMPMLRVDEASEYENLRSKKKAEAGLDDIKKQLDSLKQEVSEMRYILDTINPMEYVTLTNLEEVLEKRMKEKSGT